MVFGIAYRRSSAKGFREMLREASKAMEPSGFRRRSRRVDGAIFLSLSPFLSFPFLPVRRDAGFRFRVLTRE